MLRLAQKNMGRPRFLSDCSHKKIASLNTCANGRHAMVRVAQSLSPIARRACSGLRAAGVLMFGLIAAICSNACLEQREPADEAILARARFAALLDSSANLRMAVRA